MSQKYVIFQDSNNPDRREIVISTRDHDAIAEALKPTSLTPLSAGTVTFRNGVAGKPMADVTHGSITLKMPVDLARMIADTELIEKAFT